MLPVRHRHTRRSGTLLPVLCGSGLLLLYLVSATPLAPLLTALLAEADPNHRVAIQENAGILEVVLRHDGPAAAHHHGLLAQALTAFARPSSPVQPDHVIQFASLGVALKSATLATEPVSETMTADPPPVVEVQFGFLSPPLLTVVPARPPPVPSVRLLSLRSTLLLI